MYITSITTHLHGQLVGRPGQDLNQLVAAHYGDKNGFRHWYDLDAPTVVGLIVTPAEENIAYRSHDLGIVPRIFTTESRVLDWVTELHVEQVSN
jgi:hypothetical protein